MNIGLSIFLQAVLRELRYRSPLYICLGGGIALLALCAAMQIEALIAQANTDADAGVRVFTLVAVAGPLLGVLTAFAYAGIHVVRDPHLRFTYQLEKIIEHPVIAVVPQLKALKNKHLMQAHTLVSVIIVLFFCILYLGAIIGYRLG